MGHHEDRADIIAITHDYCWALDTGDWDALRSVFTPDVVTDLGAGGQNGIDEVIARVSSALGRLDDSQHIVATHQIRIDGDSATCRCYLHAQHILRDTPGGDHFIVGGRYEDRCIRTPDGWRIAERSLVVMWREGNTAVFGRAS